MGIRYFRGDEQSQTQSLIHSVLRRFLEWFKKLLLGLRRNGRIGIVLRCIRFCPALRR